jgi:hypothetical protein
MARLPTPGSDSGTWGQVLNDFLSVEHASDGTLKASGSLAAKADDAAVVHMTGVETVGGTKTFSSNPVVPTPTSSTHAVTKNYVDTTTILLTQKGAAAGVATLDGTTKVPLAQVPDLSGTYAVSSSGAAATQAFMASIKRNVEDAVLLVVGDSTGNDLTDWVYLFAGLLGSAWPTHSIEYSLWNDGSNTYNAPTVVSSGSGSRKVSIYNMSVAGWLTVHPLGDKFVPGIRDVQPNLTIINLGHNETMSAGKAQFARFAALTESIAAACPFTDMIMIAQNPAQTNTNQAFRATVIEELCAVRGYGFIDVHQHFIDAGMPAGWYADSVHPNATGSAQWAAVVMAHFNYTSAAAPLPRQPSSLVIPAVNNLVANGSFAGYVSGTPTNWTASNVTVSKDTTLYDSAQGYSVRLQSASAAAATFSQLVTTQVLNLIKGHYITLAVRIYLPSGSVGSHGRIAIAITGGTSVTTESFGGSGHNGWKWTTATAFVSTAATFVNALIYVDSGATGTADIRIDRVILSRGILPRDMLV